MSIEWTWEDAAKLTEALQNNFSAAYMLGILQEVVPRVPAITAVERADIEFLRQCCGPGCSYEESREVLRVLAILDKYHPRPKPKSDKVDLVHELVGRFRGAADGHESQGSYEFAIAIRGCATALEKALAQKEKP